VLEETVRARRRTKAVDAELARAAAYRTAFRRFLQRTDAAATNAGLTSQRYDLLLQVASAGALRVTDLCQRLELRQTAVTELVKRAEEAGLLERAQSAEDARSWVLRLTPEGERKLMLAFDALRDDRTALAKAFREVDASFRVATR
jgi:DNA-binding MarR family transcriptional regulator